MEEWNIQTRNIACSQCQKSFIEKALHYTILLTRANCYLRQDFCADCWESSGGTDNRSKMGVVSFWQGVYELPPSKPVDPLPKEDAESLLRKMLVQNDPSESDARYLLAVMLERKRILKHRETQNGEKRFLVYEHLKTGEVFMIQDPQLCMGQIQEVQRKVITMFETNRKEQITTNHDKKSGEVKPLRLENALEQV